MKAAIMIILGLAMIGFIDISDADNEIELLIDLVVNDTTDLNTYANNRMSHAKTEMFKVKMNTIVEFKVSTLRAINEINTLVKDAKDRGKNRDACGIKGRIELMQTVKIIVSEFMGYHKNALNQGPFKNTFKSGVDLIFHVASGSVSELTKKRFNQFPSEVITAKKTIEWICRTAMEKLMKFAEKMEANLLKGISSITTTANACTNQL